MPVFLLEEIILGYRSSESFYSFNRLGSFCLAFHLSNNCLVLNQMIQTGVLAWWARVLLTKVAHGVLLVLNRVLSGKSHSHSRRTSQIWLWTFTILRILLMEWRICQSVQRQATSVLDGIIFQLWILRVTKFLISLYKCVREEIISIIGVLELMQSAGSNSTWAASPT